MDIAIRSVGEVSGISGDAFVAGNTVWSCLYRSPEGLIERIDVLDAEREAMQVEGPVICQWGQRIKEKAVSEADERRAALETADEVFLSLFEETPDEDEAANQTRERLKYFLALQLERKRVLKPLGGRRFKHMPTKREFKVPDLEITPELIAQFQQEISLMGSVR